MEHFVTLFNTLFLPQGLALHMSMQRHIKDYVLWILCVDDQTYDILMKVDLPSVRLLKLSELETPELLEVKQGRTIAEYCWTLTPFAPRFVFEADLSIHRVTYIDADIWFQKHPHPIFDELDTSEKYVLITDHGYATEHDQSETFGQYCVQFMTFTRVGGEIVRKWWEDRCIEWCYARAENGKYGDQKYLDDWPERFGKEVHVLQAKELTLAPWNATRFPYGDAVFYHFHGLRLKTKKLLAIGNYSIPSPLHEYVYRPYYSDLRSCINLLEKNNVELESQSKNLSLVIFILRKAYFMLMKLKHSITGNIRHY